MRGAIHTRESREVIRRRVVDEPSIFGAHEEAMRKVEVSSGAIDKRGACLGAGGGEILRIEDQPSHSRQYERSEVPHRRTKDVGGGGFVRVGLHTQRAGAQPVALRVE